ncbi:NAD(P)-binding protein [Rhizodiscina lignyota]|uniref:D-arabinitol 2-dehydrogenase [ribulose-forming] n=1 Tax=Rhizodiscina lignyota TaxID=1504668 RepID=A0A9P4M8J3_9PEZI|nr:NAD(P)-binding protein [Rhizodiscina lignyota]
MAPATDDRNGLVNRILPEMKLSDGSASSMTGPPAPFPHYLNPEGRATLRFAVEGNAVITGGGGTLALEAAKALLEHGAAGLALLDVNAVQASDAAADLRKEFPEAKIIAKAVDVTNAESVATAFGESAEELGGIDMLCCFAGVVGCTHAMDMSHEQWRKAMDVNCSGAFLCAQAAARSMKEHGRGGSIVLIASISAHRVNYPQPQVAYNVSKAGVVHLAHCLAAEWASYGIRVNSISPGYMDTILNEGAGLENARNAWAARNPMGRMGSPQELQGPIVLLCSGAGSYMNGADLVVDGGAIVF